MGEGSVSSAARETGGSQVSSNPTFIPPGEALFLCFDLFHYHWVGKISWRRKWQSTPVFLPGKFRGQRSLLGYMGLQNVRHD